MGPPIMLGTHVHLGLIGSEGYRPVYAIFEGGGAKGITHIGALKALEYERLAVVGVAGSSAGAIIAALVAFGFRSDEMANAETDTDILKGHGLSPIAVLGRFAWRRFILIRRTPWPLCLCASIAFACAIAMVVDHVRARFVVIAFMVAVGCILMVLLLVLPVFIKRGLFDSSRLRSVLNAIFLAKLNENRRARDLDLLPADHKVRFADINPAIVPGCATLKIIVSEVRSGTLRIADHTTPDVVVADAVAASASIPFAFRPCTVAGLEPGDGAPYPPGKPPVYVDGGLISNLPVWSFSAEKRSLERTQGGPPIPVIAFSLDGSADSERARRRMSLLYYPVKVVLTGIFGGQTIVRRFVSDLVMISLTSPLRTLEFDCTRRDANAAIDAGFRCASRELLNLRRESEITVDVLEGILAAIRQYIAERRRAKDEPTPRLRVNLIEPVDKRLSAFRIVASAGMTNDADDRLELDAGNLIAPLVFRTKHAQFDTVKDVPARDLHMTKYERALICPQLCSVISIPIFGPWSGSIVPERVLGIDSTDCLHDVFTDEASMTFLKGIAVPASRTLIAGRTGVH